MKLSRFLLSLLCTIALIYTLNNAPADLPWIGKSILKTPAAQLPAIGKFLSPSHGFWQNAESQHPKMPRRLVSETLQAPVEIVYDERLVPHIFAENDHDLYFAQGYATAYHRLWQMEFQTLSAEGRISEVIGSKALEFDQKQRRLGLAWAAEKAVELMKKDEKTKNIVEAYSEGVNAYIATLSEKNLPLEYKLLGYSPELWSPYKCALLLKLMANRLTAAEEDVELTNVLRLLGNEKLNLLFPDFPTGQDPIVPIGTNFDFTPLPTTNDTAVVVPTPSSTPFEQQGELLRPNHYAPITDAERNLGSNNWAVAGSKTASQTPILCNDPHLRLNLPSIWYEIQLHTPEVNVYGVSMPGAPAVVIGFNEKIAWGVTNSERDVKDWYRITFKDSTKTAYKYGNEWRPAQKRVEVIKVRRGEAVNDTVIYTHYGPVTYDKIDTTRDGLALKWKLHEASNELMTFYLLNRAQNYDDYLKALPYFECPGQNFAFAASDGTIAIWQQGAFPMRYKEQGKFVMDGSKSENEWAGYIPQLHNPHLVNPERGFISSANQHPTDATYPYYYNGATFEFYRNRRLNQQLALMNDITVADMQQLQNDSYNLQAAESVPVLLSYLQPELLSDTEKQAYETLRKWNFENLATATAPTIFDKFWDKIMTITCDELVDNDTLSPTTLPYRYALMRLLVNRADDELFDIKISPAKETAREIVQIAFRQTVEELQKQLLENPNAMQWYQYRDANVEHLARIPAFSHRHIKVNGGEHILNAVQGDAGPSWRMVVSVGNNGEAWGIYPGGQSGNPGSFFYDNQIDRWANGEYNKLLLLQKPDDIALASKVILSPK